MIEIVAAICMFEFGMVVSSIGAMKLSLAKALGIDDVHGAGLISALMLTNAASVLAIGPLIDVSGHRPIAVLGLLLGAVGFFLFAFARSYRQAVVACVALGVGGSCTCTVSSTLFPLIFFGGENAAAASNLGNVFFGLGAVTTAVASTYAASGIDYRNGGVFLAVLIAVAVVPALLADYPVVQTDFEYSAALELFSRPSTLIATLVFALNTGVVNSMGVWLSSHGAAIGLSTTAANMMVALFWFAITLARFAVSFVVTLENAELTIALLATAAGTLLFCMVFVRNKTWTAILMCLTGCVLGPITPTVTGIVFARSDPAIYGSAFAILSAIGFLGASVIPGTVGLYARRRGVQEAFIIPMSVALFVALLSLLLRTAYAA